MRRPRFNFEGSKTAVYCKQHAEDGMMVVNTKLCLYDSCNKRPSFSFEGIRPAVYCKQHAEDGMICILTKRALNQSRTVAGDARRVPTDVAPTVWVQLKQEVLDGSLTSLSIEALSESAGSLKRSRGEVGGKQPTHSLDHAPLEDRLVVHPAAVKMVRSQEGARSSLGNDNGGGGGTAA
ncbi:unnamed protein product, partial [Laminaria digitata]